MVETKLVFVPKENMSLDLGLSHKSHPLRAVLVELTTAIEWQSKTVDSLMALVGNLSQTVQARVENTNIGMVNLLKDIDASISGSIS